MANVYRRPFADISIDGQIEPRIMSGRVSKGLNQNYTTADLVLPYPYPTGLKTWSGIRIQAGGDRTSANAGLHFAGHMLDPALQMWTPRGTLACGTALARLENWYPPINIPLNSLTDIEAIELIFNSMGITDRQIDGHGKMLGEFATSALTWTQQQSALEMVQQIDLQFGLGYRTFDTGTTIVRRFIPLSPIGMASTYTFEEGINCINGGMVKRRVAPAGRVVVNGDGVSSDQQSPTSNFTLTPYVVNFLMIQQEALDAGIVSAEEMGLYLLAKLTRNLVTATVITWVDDIFSPGQVVHYKAAHLLIEQNFFVQQVITSFEGARFRQQLELISELDERTTPSGYTPIGTIDPGTMEPLDPLEPLDPVDFPPVEPPDPGTIGSVVASFTILAIEREKVIVAGSEQDVWFVYCVDTSIAFDDTIATRAWLAAGPVLTTPSSWAAGTGVEFITAFTSLTDATIQLTVTTAGGVSAVAGPRAVADAPGVATKTLELFLAAGRNAEAWSPPGNGWNVDSQSALVAVQDVANGPLWTLPASATNAMRSTDYLATPAVEETIAWTDGSLAGIRSWIEPDVDAAKVAVIGSNGQLAFSSNRGDTFTLKAGPGGAGKDVILSRFVAGQVHVLTTTGYYVSDDGGTSWRTIRADTDFKWLTLSHSRNMLVTTGGVLESAETGVAQTGPSGVVTAAAHIKDDRFVALTSAGRVWRTTTNGGTAMSDLGAITGTPVHMYRHGSIPDFYVYAAGTSGAYKLIIRTNAGPTYEVMVLPIRVPGIGNSHASSDYTRVGIGRLADAGTAGDPPPPVIGPSDPQVWISEVSPGSFSYKYRYDGAGWETLGPSFAGEHPRASSNLVAASNGTTADAPYYRTTDGWSSQTSGTHAGYPSCQVANTRGYLYDPTYWLLVYGGVSCGTPGIVRSSDGVTYAQIGSPNTLTASEIAVDSSFIWGVSASPGGFGIATASKASPTIWTQVLSSLSAFSGAIEFKIYVPQQAAGYCLVWWRIPSGGFFIQRLSKVTSGGTVTHLTLPSGFDDPKGLSFVWEQAFRSRDGATWIGSVKHTNGTQRALLRSADSGATWAVVHTFSTLGGGAGGREPVYTISTYSPTSALRWFAAGGHADGGIDVVKSDDGGATWASIGRPNGMAIGDTMGALCGVGL